MTNNAAIFKQATVSKVVSRHLHLPATSHWSTSRLQKPQVSDEKKMSHTWTIMWKTVLFVACHDAMLNIYCGADGGEGVRKGEGQSAPLLFLQGCGKNCCFVSMQDCSNTPQSDSGLGVAWSIITSSAWTQPLSASKTKTEATSPPQANF